MDGVIKSPLRLLFALRGTGRGAMRMHVNRVMAVSQKKKKRKGEGATVALEAVWP